MITLHGHTDAGYGRIADAFRANFTDRGDTGAAVAVVVDGVLVTDLWAGMADPERGTRWTARTATLTYSVTKGAAATCVHLLAESGLLGLDDPVARHWPEFGAAGKEEVTVRQLLSHQAGLPVLRGPVGRDELLPDGPVGRLAAQEPLWAPGTRHGYHALTFGWLVGELVRRITGESLGRFFARTIAQPLGLDFWIGLPAGRRARVAPLMDAGPAPEEPGPSLHDEKVRSTLAKVDRALADPDSLLIQALTTGGALPTPDPHTWNDPAVQAAEVPAAGGIGDARSLARLYGACVAEVDGVRLLSDATVAAASAEQVAGPDAVTVWDSRFAVGYQLPTVRNRMVGPTSFGHNGVGGGLGFADPAARLGFGYVTTRMGRPSPVDGDGRPGALVDALRDCLG